MRAPSWLLHALAIGLIAVPLVSVFTAGAARAVPTVDLIWTDTSGTGTSGTNGIDASPGDMLTLTIFLSNTVPASGIQFAGLSLTWDGGISGGFTGVSAAECPHAGSIPTGGNSIAGLCTPTGFVLPFFSPFSPGFVSFFPDSTISSFDAGGLPPGTTGTVELGAISFMMNFPDTVSVWYKPGIDAVNDGFGGVFFPSASAHIVPEPATGGLLTLGLAALGAIGRRRS